MNKASHTRGSSLRTLLKQDLARYNLKRGGLIGGLESFIFDPGFATVLVHRVAAHIYAGGRIRRVVASLIWAYNTRASACHLSLRAQIDGGLRLPHPTGIVIGEGVRIGRNATVFQNVTLGSDKRQAYPSLGDDVTVYPGSVVSGAAVLGNGATVGANSVVRNDVEAGATVAGAPARPLGA